MLLPWQPGAGTSHELPGMLVGRLLVAVAAAAARRPWRLLLLLGGSRLGRVVAGRAVAAAAGNLCPGVVEVPLQWRRPAWLRLVRVHVQRLAHFLRVALLRPELVVVHVDAGLGPLTVRRVPAPAVHGTRRRFSRVLLQKVGAVWPGRVSRGRLGTGLDCGRGRRTGHPEGLLGQGGRRRLLGRQVCRPIGPGWFHVRFGHVGRRFDVVVVLLRRRFKIIHLGRFVHVGLRRRRRPLAFAAVHVLVVENRAGRPAVPRRNAVYGVLGG